MRSRTMVAFLNNQQGRYSLRLYTYSLLLLDGHGAEPEISPFSWSCLYSQGNDHVVTPSTHIHDSAEAHICDTWLINGAPPPNMPLTLPGAHPHKDTPLTHTLSLYINRTSSTRLSSTRSYNKQARKHSMNTTLQLPEWFKTRT